MRRLAFLAALLLTSASAVLAGSTPPFRSSTLAFNGVPDGNVTIGSDGNLWVLEVAASRIGRLTPSGAYDTFKLPFTIPYIGSFSWRLANGPDGNLWLNEYLEAGKAKLARITPDGVITEFPLPGNLEYPSMLTGGTDGKVWFRASGRGRTNSILAISTVDGSLTTIPVTFEVDAMTGSANGNIWIAADDNGTNKIVRLTPSGQMTTFAMPLSGGFVPILIDGPDGNLWFHYRVTDGSGDRIGRIRPDGKITMYRLPTPNSWAIGLAIGMDGNLWFGERATGRIGQVIVSSATDDGGVTINESSETDLVSPDAANFFLLPAKWATPESAAAGVMKDKKSNCPEIAYTIHILESRDPKKSSIKRGRAPYPAKCADLAVYVELDRYSKTGTTFVEVHAQNNGPDTADDVQVTIFTTRTLNEQAFSIAVRQENWPSLVSGALRSTLVALPYDEDVDAVVFSKTPDPDTTNNRTRAVIHRGVNVLPIDLTAPVVLPRRGK